MHFLLLKPSSAGAGDEETEMSWRCERNSCYLEGSTNQARERKAETS